MFSNTKEISAERLYIITRGVCYGVLFYCMLSISILIYKMCLDDNDYKIQDNDKFIMAKVLSGITAVFVIVLFMGSIIFIDELLRFTTDSVIIIGILALMYH